MVFFAAVNLLLFGLVHVTVGSPCLGGGGICEAVGGVTESFSESAQSVSSASSSSYQSSSSSFNSVTSGSSCSGFDSAYWTSIFDKCSCFSNIERQCYLKWLETFASGGSLEYFSSIADYLTIKEALKNDILDYTLLQTDICAAYEFFNSKGIYSVDFDLTTQSSIFEEYAKSKLTNTLKCLGPSSPLYNLLKYSIESDFTTLPCTVGFLNSIVQSQSSYFSSSYSSSSSSSSSTSTRSVGSSSGGSCSNDVSQYLNILTAAKIKEDECQTYLKYLGQVKSDKLCLFTELIDYLNSGKQVFTEEMILDFANLNSELHSLYELLVKEEFFAANADWLAKEAILSELKCKLSSALGYMTSSCSLYTALQYCLEKDGLCYLPLCIGLSNYLLEQQSSYFSVSSSSSTTVSTSSSSSLSSGGCSKTCR